MVEETPKGMTTKERHPVGRVILTTQYESALRKKGELTIRGGATDGAGGEIDTLINLPVTEQHIIPGPSRFRPSGMVHEYHREGQPAPEYRIEGCVKVMTDPFTGHPRIASAS
jgi:hypothetical protein